MMTPYGRFTQAHLGYFGAPRPQEVAVLAKVAELPVRKVQTGDAATLVQRGFKAGECHVNSRRAASENGGTHLTGWTVTRNVYFLHSVVSMPDGKLHCVTPAHTDELDPEGQFDFVVDPDFYMDEGGFLRRHDAIVVAPTTIGVVRRDPAATGAVFDALADQLAAGTLTFEEAEVLARPHL